MNTAGSKGHQRGQTREEKRQGQLYSPPRLPPFVGFTFPRRSELQFREHPEGRAGPPALSRPPASARCSSRLLKVHPLLSPSLFALQSGLSQEGQSLNASQGARALSPASSSGMENRMIVKLGAVLRRPKGFTGGGDAPSEHPNGAPPAPHGEPRRHGWNQIFIRNGFGRGEKASGKNDYLGWTPSDEAGLTVLGDIAP